MKTSSALPLSVALFAAAATADPATGWIQTGAGTYDYNDAANWVDGEINGIFSADLTLADNQAASFAPTFELVPGTSGKLSVETTATTSQLWYTRAPELTVFVLL